MFPASIPRFEFVRWPEPLARLDPPSRVFALSLAISILIHAVVLSIHFTFPAPHRSYAPNTLDVVFVNSRTRSKPIKAEVLAQVNLDRGGDTDTKHRAKSPLPFRRRAVSGRDTSRASRRVRELEARQRQLLTQLKAKTVAPVEPAKPRKARRPKPTGADFVSRSLAIARLEAQVSRSIDEYSKRPRKHFVGARAKEYRFAQYVADWRRKVERIGNLNYPEDARGRIYGSLRLAVSINADGSLAGLELERSSGHKILDEAAERIVRMGAPYAKFPPDIRRDTDILVITRTWHFSPGDKMFSD